LAKDDVSDKVPRASRATAGANAIRILWTVRAEKFQYTVIAGIGDIQIATSIKNDRCRIAEG
jgi:hypothetical protein